MCYCNSHFFTINRADNFMVGRLPERGPDEKDFWREPLPEPDLIYTIDPESLIQIIEEMEAMGIIECRHICESGGTKHVSVILPSQEGKL